jgi:CheY-like chemotaxis protein
MNLSEKVNQALVVDDIPVNVKIMSLLLKGLGVEVVTALEAEEALGKVPPEGFDLALVDIQLEGEMDGYQLSQKLKQTHPEMFILGVTGNRVTPEFIEEAIKRGMNHVVEKPLTKDSLLSILEKEWLEG